MLGSETLNDPVAVDYLSSFAAEFDADILDRKRNLMKVSSLRQCSLCSGHNGSVEGWFLIILVGVNDPTAVDYTLSFAAKFYAVILDFRTL